MEDQGKRLLLAVGIIAVLFVVWNYLFPPQRAQPQQQQAQPAQPAQPGAPQAAPTAPAAPGTAAAPSPAPADAPPAASCTPETEGAPTWDTPDYTATFSRCGGAVASFVLKGNQYREVEGGKEVQMDLVRAQKDPTHYALQSSIAAAAAGVVSPDAPRVPIVASGAEWTLAAATADAVSYRITTADGLQVTKTFKRLAGKYVFGLDVEVKNVSEKAGDKRIVETSIETYGFQDPNVSEPSMFHYAPPAWGTACFVNDKYHREVVNDLKGESRFSTGDVRWTGPDHQYFLFAYGPVGAEPSSCARGFVPGAHGVLRTALQHGLPSSIEPGQSVTHSLIVYAGPKLLDQLEGVSKIAGKETHFREAVDLGWFAILCRPMLFLLKLFHGWFGSWGVAIILLTVVVKLLTLYWTTKSMRSMKAMSRLKPEMDKIRDKYPDDKQRQNQEMMNLYKTHQISPFGGCLPLLLQMPIWFALYRTLASAADLYRAPFIGYIKDLTAPDPYYILPVLLTGLMFWQMRLTPATVDSQQQKIMQWMMPIMMGVFSLLFPSGLAVYMLTNTLLGMIHQVWMNRTDGSPKPAVAVAVPAASASAPPAPGAARPGRKGGKNRAKA